MMLIKKAALFVVFTAHPLHVIARDVILEFKGAYFLPTGRVFKDIFNRSALYGPELTVQVCNESSWYAFAAVDYFKTKGCSLCLASPTKVTLLPVTFGIKYFVPVGFQCLDPYVGLGCNAMRVRTEDCYLNNKTTITKWGFGGIVKAGVYCYLPHNFVLDFFINYDFLTAGKNGCCASNPAIQFRRAHLNGVQFGAGLGYRF